MNRVIIHLGEKPLSMEFKEFDSVIDVDQLTKIDHSNLYGEAVTVPALLNHVGMLKAETERLYALKKLDTDIYEADLRQRLRKYAVTQVKKLTEDGLNEQVILDKGYQNRMKELISTKFDMDAVDKTFWSVSAKNKKLDNLIKAVTPEELFAELQEGVINNILIRKHKSLLERDIEKKSSINI